MKRLPEPPTTPPDRCNDCGEELGRKPHRCPEKERPWDEYGPEDLPDPPEDENAEVEWESPE